MATCPPDYSYTYVIVSLPTYYHHRLADLHRTMNVHTKPPSTVDGEGAWQGVWPSGRMFGKKGDILKLVSRRLEAA